MATIDHARGNHATLRWLLYDGHGNMVRTMNTSFALSAFQWRGVWGERSNSTPVRGYCANLGHPEDETGLVYMRARYYEPTTGRFISEDPARDGVNWYLYADGDPVGKVDASGRNAFKITALLSCLDTFIKFFEKLVGIDISNGCQIALKILQYYYFLKSMKELSAASDGLGSLFLGLSGAMATSFMAFASPGFMMLGSVLKLISISAKAAIIIGFAVTVYEVYLLAIE